MSLQDSVIQNLSEIPLGTQSGLKTKQNLIKPSVDEQVAPHTPQVEVETGTTTLESDLQFLVKLSRDNPVP